MASPGWRLRNWSGTARRLALAFGALILAFAFTAGFALSGLRDLQQGLQGLRERERQVALALQLASAVRDQYAHQAHTLIIGDRSHLGFYGEARERVLALTRQVRIRAANEEERALVDDIERASGELDEVFRERIVPAMLADRQAEVQSQHEVALAIVDRIQQGVDRLVASFDRTLARLEEQAHNVAGSSYRLVAGAFVAMVLLAAAIGLYIGRSIAVPLTRLSEGTARLAAGDLDARIPDDGPDEFGALARRFNAMTAALKANQERLVQSEKLAGIGRLAAGVAHEINNPLGVILGYTRLLARKADPALASDLRVIEDETLRSQEIVEGLLDLARPVRVASLPVDLRDLTEEVVERLRETRLIVGTEVRVEGRASAAGNSAKLRQVLLNLIKNAAQAAGPKGSIRVEMGEAEGAAWLDVSDSGPGLSAEAQRRLFEPFFSTKSDGSGLGLAVSRAIARAHGGELEAGVASLGGARFRLTLPLRQERSA